MFPQTQALSELGGRREQEALDRDEGWPLLWCFSLTAPTCVHVPPVHWVTLGTVAHAGSERQGPEQSRVSSVSRKR